MTQTPRQTLSLPALLLIATSVLSVSCRQTAATNSKLRIDGGELITKDSVNKIDGVFYTMTSVIGASSGGACTGSAVSDNTVITAAHCVFDGARFTKDGALSGVQFCITNAIYDKLCSTKIYVNPKYPANAATSGGGHDTAFVVFPDKTFKNYFPIESNPIKVNDPVVFVGYSKYHLTRTDAGSKRFGYNKIAYFERSAQDDIFTASNAVFDRVGVSPGDSGGPMMKECKVIGVASRMAGDQPVGKRSIHTNLTHKTTQDFLKTMGAKAGAYFCGLSGNDKNRCAPEEKYQYIASKWQKGREFPCEVTGGGSGDDGDGDSKPGPSSNINIAIEGSDDVTLLVNAANADSGADVTVCTGTTLADAKSCKSPIIAEESDPFKKAELGFHDKDFFVHIKAKDSTSASFSQSYKVSRK